VMSLELNLVKQRVQHLVRMMARMMGVRSKWVSRSAHCSGRNYLMEIRLEKSMVNRKAKRSVNYLGIHSVSWKEMTKEKQKADYSVMSLELRLVKQKG